MTRSLAEEALTGRSKGMSEKEQSETNRKLPPTARMGATGEAPVEVRSILVDEANKSRDILRICRLHDNAGVFGRLARPVPVEVVDLAGSTSAGDFGSGRDAVAGEEAGDWARETVSLDNGARYARREKEKVRGGGGDARRREAA